MRIQGRITSWNDDKGFGFITSNKDKKRIFVHIKSFCNRQQRPKNNQLVSYTLSADNQKRPCAVDVTLSGDTPCKKMKHKKGTISVFFASLFLIFVGFSVALNKIPLLIFGLYLILSLLTFIVYAKDKKAAKTGSWRISENTLHMFALIGGWPGAIIAQQQLCHKSTKQSFRFVFWITALLNGSAFAWLFTPQGSLEIQYWIDVKLTFWIDNVVKPLF